MKILLAAFFTVSYLSLSTSVFAAHPLSTDDAGTVGTHKFQIEASSEFSWDMQDGTKSTEKLLIVGVTAGVLDSLDLIFSFPFKWQQVKTNDVTELDNSGLKDLSLELKWRFLELGPASFAIKPSVILPTASRDRNLGKGRAGYGVKLISTIELKPISIYTNAGYSYQGYSDTDKVTNRQNLWNLSLAGTLEVMKSLLLVAEIGTGSNPDKAGTTWPTFAACGMIYSIQENLEFDLGIKGGLNKPEIDIALLSGVTFRFP